MGKSDYEVINSNNITKNSTIDLCVPVIQNNFKSIMNDEKTFENLDNQVAGHIDDGLNLGMLVYEDRVYKPITRFDCGKRETDFYKGLNKTDNQIKNFVPRYYGNEFVKIGNRNVECMVLEHLTKNFKEPCIMDIKIGKRTWDPLANNSKIKKEEEKYKKTKSTLGFCITGFQYYDITSGKLQKFSKDYGKMLDQNTVKDAIRTFLNGESKLSRSLLVQFLVNLWRIQNWAKKQNKLRFYSSSILLIYDNRKLRNCLEEKDTFNLQPPVRTLTRTNSLYRPISITALNAKDKIPTGFSGQLTSDGPNLLNPTNTKPFNFLNNNNDNKKKKSIPTLKRIHSHQNNYENELHNMRKEYAYLLDDLVCENKNELWVNVRLIDFAHTFPAENENVDFNYLYGLENLINIFEGFLKETSN